jgi:hypothetical protein
MATRLPASERTREELRALIDGRLGSSEARSALLRLATRLIVEEALEVEVEDALGRGYYEHGAVAGRVTPSGKTLVAQNRLRWEGVTMANKASFTPDEWKQLLEAPMLASMAVTAAEPSGLWGMLKESFAAGGRGQGQGRCRHQRADQGGGDGFRERRRAQRRPRRFAGAAQGQQARRSQGQGDRRSAAGRRAVGRQGAGVLIERWLFFAEATHTVTLYYGRRTD